VICAVESAVLCELLTSVDLPCIVAQAVVCIRSVFF